MGASVPARVLLATILAIFGLAACAADDDGCRKPTAREVVFPFTGAWQEQVGQSRLCLYQQDAQRVLGRWGSRAIVGLVRPDGRLDIAAGDARSSLLITVRKHGDTLRVERGLTADGQDAMTGPFVRHR